MLFLHSVGAEVQEIFNTLQDTGEDINSVEAKLKECLQLKCNSVKRKKEKLKTNPFLTRLRKLALMCDFYNSGDNIRDQIIEKYKSARRRKH